MKNWLQNRTIKDKKKIKKLKAWACVHKKPIPKEWPNPFQTHPCYEGSFALDIYETKKEAERNLEKHLKVIPCEISYEA